MVCLCNTYQTCNLPYFRPLYLFIWKSKCSDRWVISDKGRQGSQSRGIENYREKNNGLLFHYGKHYHCFVSSFNRIIDNNRQDFYWVCIHPVELGSHSSWKGLCNFSSKGSTASTPMDSIKLYECCGMGPLKERYLF